MKVKSKRLLVLGAALATAAAVAVPAALSVTVSGFLSPNDPKQHDRLFRDGVPSGCHGKANPGLLGDGLSRSYDRYRLTNSAGTAKCVHVVLHHVCVQGAFAQANSTFIPSDPSANYLGDAGQSGSPESFQFTAPARHTFDVVVNEVDGGVHNPPCPYRLTVSIPGQLSFTVAAGS